VSRARAQLIIARKHVPPDSSEDGIAFTNTLNGSIVSASIGLRENLDDYEAALVATHELGHVLGLAHEDDGCAVMNSWLFDGHPFKCEAPAPGKWWCQLLTKDDILGAVRIYGGRPKNPVRPNCARHS
jgi:hypothetical protein